MAENILNIDEVVEFLSWKVQVGEIISVNMIQRNFRSGYSTARRTMDKLVELGYVVSKEQGIVRYYRKK